ncbi:reverse transcriptase domain-containing protein [Tanacetum coccineum]
MPHTIITDNGTQFIGEPFKSWYEMHGIHQATTPPYHLQANGKADVANKEIVKGIKKRMEEYKTYRTEVVIPIEVLIHIEQVAMVIEDENEDSRRLDISLAKEKRNLATILLAHFKHKMDKYYNKQVYLVPFKPGNHVM